MPRLLITGFGPFPRMPVNPSGLLAARLAGSPLLRRRLGGRPDVLVLRTAYGALREQLEPALAAGPDAVLMIGVSARASGVRVELQARNRTSRLFPDADGHRPARLCLEPCAPLRRASPAAVKVLCALRGRGVAGSRDAGRYLCNASYHRVLAAGVPAVFLHIPPLARKARRPKPATRAGAYEACITAARVLLLHARSAAGTGRAGDGASR